MERRETLGLVTYHFESIPTEHVNHAVLSRLGGVSTGPFSSLNVGSAVGDDEAAVSQNHSIIYAHLGLSAEQVVTCHQVHSNRVAVVTLQDGGHTIPDHDGLVTNVPGVALLLRYADCQPILLYDPVRHALGLAHAGWRGAALGLARRAVETMQSAFGTDPKDLVAGLGPAIGPCCYTVGHEVASAMGYALPDWSQVMSLDGDRWRFDLPAANAQQLAAAGVRTIEQAHLCTACHRLEFYSHRGDRGSTGRFAVLAQLKHKAQGSGPVPTPGAIAAASEAVVPPDSESLHPPGLPTFQETFGGDL